MLRRISKRLAPQNGLHLGSRLSMSSVAASPSLIEARVAGEDPNTVFLTLSDGSSPDPVTAEFSSRWLWQNNLDRWAQKGSGQRTLEPHTLPAREEVGVESCAVNGEGEDGRLHLVWKDGSTGTFSPSFLLANEMSSPRAGWRQLPASTLSKFKRAQQSYEGVAAAAKEAEQSGAGPDTALETAVDKCEWVDGFPTMQYEELLAEDCSEALWRWLVLQNRFGLVLVRNAGNGDDVIHKLAELAGGLQPTIYGTTFVVKAMQNPINIAYSNVALGLHQDLVYYESPPGLQLLHCQRFDERVQGGESMFLDAVEAAEDFRKENPNAFMALATIPATFQKIHKDRADPVHMVYRRPHFTVSPDLSGQSGGLGGQVTTVTWAPAFEGPLCVPPDLVEPYVDSYRAFAQFLHARSQDPAYLVQKRLDEGDVMVFNNRRMLHARAAYTLPDDIEDGARRLHGCYVNIDHFKSKLHVLSDQFGGGRHAQHVANHDYF